MVMDILENNLLVIPLVTSPNKRLCVAALAGYITAIKWSLLGCLLLQILSLLVNLYWQEKDSKKNTKKAPYLEG
jgi:hypothetical protein